MNRKLIGVLLVALVIITAGIVVWRLVGGKENGGAGVAEAERAKHESPTVLRGSNPADERLRDGAKQVQDPAEALAMARESLVRIEREMSSAENDEQRAVLEKKKEIINGIITRLEKER